MEYRIIKRKGCDDKIVYRSEEHTSELQSLRHLVCRLLLEKKTHTHTRQAIEYKRREDNSETPTYLRQERKAQPK